MNSVMHRVGDSNSEVRQIVEVISFKPFVKNTLQGFLDLKLPAIGLSISGCTLHQKNESRWVGLPGRQYEENGEKKWAVILDFASKEAKNSFQKAAIAAVDQYLGGQR